MNQFRVLPAKPALQKLVRSENPLEASELKPDLWQEVNTQTHMNIFRLFKDDHSDKTAEMAKQEGQVHIRTSLYGPYRLDGYLDVPPDAVCMFIPLKNADGADASSQDVWSKVGLKEPERVLWQIESPFRMPACSRLYILDRNARFLVVQFHLERQPAVDGDGKETQPAVGGYVDVSKAGKAQPKHS